MIDSIKNNWRELTLSQKVTVIALVLVALALHDFAMMQYPEIPKWKFAIGLFLALFVCLPWILFEACVDGVRWLQNRRK